MRVMCCSGAPWAMASHVLRATLLVQKVAHVSSQANSYSCSQIRVQFSSLLIFSNTIKLKNPRRAER